MTPKMTDMVSEKEAAQAEPKQPKPRPWWKKRRVWGGACVGVAAIVATLPVAPIITLGAVVITTGTMSTTLAFLGTFVFGYGKGAADERTGQNVTK